MPHYSYAYNNRGSVHKARGKLDLAIADYNEALRLKPDFAEALKSRGDAYRAQGKADLADADHAEAARIESGSPAPAIRIQQAQAAAPAAEPGSAQDHLKRGIAHGQKGEVDRAIAEFNKAIAVKPDAVTFYSRGVAHMQKRDNDNAIADFTEAIRLQPDYADAVVNRANVYAVKGDADEAIAGYTEAIRIKPDFALAYVNRGRAYMRGEQFYTGLHDLAEATRIERAFAKALLEAVVYRAATKILGGSSASAGVIVAQGGAQGLVAIGAARFVQGRYLETISDCEAAIQLNPNLADAFLLRGASLIAQGDIERGIADLKQAARLDR
jgi:tetratricopeptide (TPR) repeat protein